MNADRWIARIFEPALTSGRIMDKIVASELAGGVEALRVAGVIEPDRADGLLRQLDDARSAQVDSSRARLSGAQPLDPEPTNLLRGVLVPVVPLVGVDAITLVLLTLELWEQDVHLMAACLQTQRTQELEAVGRRQLETWGDMRRQARNWGLPHLHTPPDEPSVRYLGSVMLALRDDVGTTYEFRGRSIGGSQTEWRLTQQWRPGVPVQASILTVDVQNSDGVTVHSVELDLHKDLITAAPG